MEPPWYAAGLAFECTRCGNCCTGAPGEVRVSEEEVVALATAVGLDLADFHERCMRVLDDGSNGLVEKPDGDCVFWSRAHGCLVYAARPRQCRTWPFWRRNVADPERWAAAAAGCPGIGRGERHDAETIARTAADDGTSGDAPR
jgi:Fe-S-cluster containining protein